MKLPQADASREKAEPTIALINIVFLMLIFFLVAAQVAPPLEKDVTLPKTGDLDASPPPDALVILSDGTLRFRGDEVTVETYLAALTGDDAALEAVRLVPDRDLSARTLLDISQDLRKGGAQSIMVVTERDPE